ncbi:LysM peptidoglycan-binding domain-containing protein [Hymenobacter nivis]|uniref:LysM peptidoglycan-binding domain-containing protein n=1 Tax=Hymenobacter nivis TaxID=1850093 RepID=A0A502GYZ5_9BACT|nr:LysM peptidoglycan-binding domain-containing protein [Hymenobacter nivis]TPG67291.1 LysM peptidoglycan-binding domain-containing protein [Hymenobacter nivis]
MNTRFLLLALLALAGAPAAAQRPAAGAHPSVPAELDALGLHLVLTEEARRLVQARADALVRHQPSFQARVDLADAAFPLIDQTLQQAGVPRDFRYLALQESALLPDAESAHGAVGYWQFKRETATGLGLRVDGAVDERKHLAASTRGAARYLLQSNAALRNWLDALLSYYTGLGGVRPYTLPTDAGATEMAITADTSPYVLMFLAQKLAYEPACGLNPNPARLRELPAVPGQGLAQQAQALGVPPEALATQNRWLLAATVPTDGRAYTLVVPVATAAQAAAVLARQGQGASPDLPARPVADARHPAEVRVNDLRALIALPGETTADLARRGGQHLPRFLRDNDLRPFDAAVPGRPYYLEGKRDDAEVEYYVVQPNETVADVAQKFGVRRHALLNKNRLAPSEALRPGRVLWLQHTRPRHVAIEYRTPPETRAPGPVLVAAAPRPAAPAATPPSDGTDATADDADDARAGWPVPLPTRPRRSGPLPTAAPAPVPAVVPAVVPTVVYRPAPAKPTPVPEVVEEEEPAPPPAPPVPVRRPTPSAAEAAPVARPTRPAPAPAPAPARPVAAKPVAAPPVATAPAATAAPAVPSRYQVQPHEGVYAIARRYNLRPADLLAWNQLPPNAGLTVGQVLRLTPPPAAGAPSTTGIIYQPRATAAPAAAPAAGAPAPPAATAAPAVWHAVLAGETLYSLSKRYAVSVSDLQAWNHKPDPSVRLGEVLRMNAPPAR